MMRGLGWTLFGAWALVSVWRIEPDVGLGDAGEIGAAAHALGVPHPTGFPVLMVILRAAEFLPLGPLAFRQNFAVALLGAASLALVGMIAATVSERASLSRSASVLGALIATVTLGTWTTFTQSAYSVEIYTLGLFVALAALFAHLAMRSHAVSGLWAGVAAGTHIVGFVIASTVALVRAFPLKRRRVVTVKVGSVAGLLALAYLPLASHKNSPLDWGDPETLSAFLAHITGARIRAAYAGTHLTAQDASSLFGQLGELWPWLPGIAMGLFVASRRARPAFAVLALLFCLDVAFALFANPMGIADRQVGHLTGALLSVLAGVGVSSIANRLPASAPWTRCLLARRSAQLGLGALVLGLALTHSGATIGAGATELFGSGGPLTSVPPRTLFVCSTDDACSGALFALYAENVRPDVDVVPAQHLWTHTSQRVLERRLRTPVRHEPRAPLDRLSLARELAATLAIESPIPTLFEDRADAPNLRPSPHVPFLSSAGMSDQVQLVETLNELLRARMQDSRIAHRTLRWAWSRTYDAIGTDALARNPTLAVHAFKRARDIARDRPTAWSNLGVAYERVGDAERALICYRRAVDLDPTRPTPWANLVRLLEAHGQHEAAAETRHRARELGVRDPRIESR